MSKKSACAVAALLACGIALPVWADDEDDVAAAMNAWGDYLAKGSTEEPGEILTLYAEDGVLWGTISRTRRDDPAAIRDYFVNAYKALPNLSVTFEDPNIRVYGGDTAINTGYYTFTLTRTARHRACRPATASPWSSATANGRSSITILRRCHSRRSSRASSPTARSCSAPARRKPRRPRTGLATPRVR